MKIVLVGATLGAVIAVVVVLATDGGDEPAPAPASRPAAAQPAADPGRFMAGIVRAVAENRYGSAWDSLHPSHKLVARRSEYVSCEERTPTLGRVQSVRVLAVTDERIRLPGRTASVAGKAVSIRLALTDGVGAPFVLTHTFHAVAVSGRWAWFLPAPRFRNYRRDHCPGVIPAPGGDPV